MQFSKPQVQKLCFIPLKIIFIEIHFGSEQILGLKKIWVWKNFGSEKNFGPKNICLWKLFLDQTFFPSKIFLGLRIFFWCKFFEAQNFSRNQHFSRPKICSDPKWISMKMIFGGIKQRFWTWGFLNCSSQRFYLKWSLTLKTKSCFIQHFLIHHALHSI